MAEVARLAKATWRVLLGGKDLTEKLRPRLISLTLRETRSDEADQVDIVISDHDGAVALPPCGAELSIELGWERGSGLPLGLVDKGTFTVDEVRHRGAPDQIIIRARSADFTGALRNRKERSFVGKTVGHIIGAIAADNKLSPQVHAALRDQVIPALGSGPISDAALLKSLGRRFDAVATIKKSRLIFSPIGSGKTATGKALAAISIDRSDTTGPHDYERVERDNYTGVEAVWHDKGTATRHTVTVGEGGSARAKRLRKVYASEADAQAAAQSEFDRKVRAKAKISISMAYGRPDIGPDGPVRLSGYKAEVTERKWLVSEASHTMDGTGGLTTHLELEASSI